MLAALPTGGVAAPLTIPAGAVAGSVTGGIAGKLTGELITNALFANRSGSGGRNAPQLKVPRSGVSGKEAARGVPSWARGQRPRVGEDGKSFARRLLDEKYGAGQWRRGPNTEFNQIKKWGDRGFVEP